MRKPPVPKRSAYKMNTTRTETVSPEQLRAKYGALKQQVKDLQRSLDLVRSEKKTSKIQTAQKTANLRSE